MRALSFPLLLDENIHPAVGAELATRGLDVESVVSVGLAGASDTDVLRYAVSSGRVVVTHDSDFGTLAVRVGLDVVGIVYLRPAHIDPAVVLEMLSVVDAEDVECVPPFVVVADKRGDVVRVRLRKL